jgi:hypothetical protein
MRVAAVLWVLNYAIPKFNTPINFKGYSKYLNNMSRVQLRYEIIEFLRQAKAPGKKVVAHSYNYYISLKTLGSLRFAL